MGNIFPLESKEGWCKISQNDMPFKMYGLIITENLKLMYLGHG